VTQAQIATYRAAFKEARESFNRATKRLAEIQFEEWELKEEVSRLRRTITALAAMCSENPFIDDLGITDAVTEVMQTAKSSLTTAAVVQRVEALGYDINSQKNASASVHAILTRLAKKDVIRKETDDEKTVIWKGPNYDPQEDAIPF
jgi:hypothetical protein